MTATRDTDDMSEQSTSETGSTAAVDERRRLTILLGVLGGMIALALLWFFVISPLLLGDEDEPVDEPVAAPTTPAPDDVTTVPPTPDEGDDAGVTLPVETYEIFLARDPFEPIRPAADGGAGQEDGNGTEEDNGDNGDGTTNGDNGDGTTNGDNGDGTTNGDNGDGENGDLPPTNGGEEADGDGAGGEDRGDRQQVDRHEVVLIDVFTENGSERAVVRVDSTSYTVGEGDTFADSFRALSIDPPCGTFLYGDNRFQLCEGDRVLK